MSALTVRPIERRDLPRVWEMIHGLAEFEKLLDILTGDAGRLERALFETPPFLYGRVAQRDDGVLVGYALYHFTFSSFRTNPRMWLEDLYVDPSARGTGAGEKLLAAFAADALAKGAHRVDWDVLEWNPARGFYERMGAAPSAEGFLKYGMDADAMRALIARESR
jgi:GNAT superfamily N-acetyltransferase